MLTLVSEKQRENVESKRQREVSILNALNQGKKYEEIARELFVSYATVRNTIYDLLQANNCRNSRELLHLARQSNFFTPENIQDNGS